MGFTSLFHRRKDEYTLEDAIAQNKLHPRTFLIPSADEINKLQIGEQVQLIFILRKPMNNGCRAERMWVTIAQIRDAQFTGVLDNKPCYLKSLRCGDCVQFSVYNISCIKQKGASLNEKLFAIITKKALEQRQINWATRSNDLHSEQDSGWQLFYGDESESYLDDVKNSTLASLETVLYFEPLLEEAFRGTGTQYEYSEKLNRFVEVKE